MRSTCSGYFFVLFCFFFFSASNFFADTFFFFSFPSSPSSSSPHRLVTASVTLVSLVSAVKPSSVQEDAVVTASV